MFFDRSKAAAFAGAALLACCVGVTACGTSAGIAGAPFIYNTFLFVADQGSSSAGFSSGVSGFSLGAKTHALKPLADPESMLATDYNLSSIAAHPSGLYLYAVNVTTSELISFSVGNDTGALTEVSRLGAGAVHQPGYVLAHPNGRFLYVMNEYSLTDAGAFTHGGISAFALDPVAGTPLFKGEVQTDPSPSLAQVALSPDARFLYQISNTSDRVSAYSIDDSSGALSLVGRYSTEVSIGGGAPKGLYPTSSTITPDGKFLYTTNYNDDTVTYFHRDTLTGALSSAAIFSMTSGDNPISAIIDPTGRFIYVSLYGSNSIGMYSIDSGTGALTSLGASVATAVGSVSSGPRDLAMDPTGGYLFVANSVDSNNIARFQIDLVSGALLDLTTTVTGYSPQKMALLQLRASR